MNVRGIDMILEMLGWGYFILAIIFLIHTVVWSITRLHYILKNGKKQLKNPKYYMKYYYDNHVNADADVPTEEDLQLLCELIEKLKKQQKSQQKTE